MIHPDTDGRRILVHERHAALARDGVQVPPGPEPKPPVRGAPPRRLTALLLAAAALAGRHR